MKRLAFVLVALVVMCGAEARTLFADQDMPDDGGGCTSQPCLGNGAVGRGEDRMTAPGSGGKKLEAYDGVVGGARETGLVALGPARGPGKNGGVVAAMRRLFGRFW